MKYGFKPNWHVTQLTKLKAEKNINIIFCEFENSSFVSAYKI